MLRAQTLLLAQSLLLVQPLLLQPLQQAQPLLLARTESLAAPHLNQTLEASTQTCQVHRHHKVASEVEERPRCMWRNVHWLNGESACAAVGKDNGGRWREHARSLASQEVRRRSRTALLSS